MARHLKVVLAGMVMGLSCWFVYVRGWPGAGVSQITGWIPGIGGSGKTAMVGVVGLRVGAVRLIEESGKRVVVVVVFRNEWVGGGGVSVTMVVVAAAGSGRMSLVWKTIYLS